MTPMEGGRLFVKICGITSAEDALLAVEAGADAVGLVFWPGSPRHVDTATARRISGALPASVVRVGVFVDAPVDDMARAAEEACLDLLQLHGNEPPEALRSLPRRAWKAVRVGWDFAVADALRYEGHAAGILLDSRAEGPPGGTGKTFDWTLAREVRKGASFLVLAGGLDPENVATAIALVRPDGIDVSSGVEMSPGRKDPARMRAFVAAARSVS
jgi:phosphoribosylanthranilate isomerase